MAATNHTPIFNLPLPEATDTLARQDILDISNNVESKAMSRTDYDPNNLIPKGEGGGIPGFVMNMFSPALNDLITPTLLSGWDPATFKGGYWRIGNMVFVNVYARTSGVISDPNWRDLVSGLPVPTGFDDISNPISPALAVWSIVPATARVNWDTGNTSGSIRIIKSTATAIPTGQQLGVNGWYLAVP